MNVSTPIPHVCCVIYETQYLLASSFMRLQEFYESPYEDIHDCYFTREHYEDLYASKNGNFTYYQDWAGFNIPLSCVRKFWHIFRHHDLYEKECRLLVSISKALADKGMQYLIGVVDGDTMSLNHELAHGLYATNTKYHADMSRLVANVDTKKLRKKLMDMGYDGDKVDDEVQAYLSTTDWPKLSKWKTGIRKGDVQKFRKVFNRYMKEHRRPY